MSAQEALRERTKKAAEVSREQVYAYIGVNDYWYEQARRQPSVLQELPSKLRGLTDERVNVRKAFEPYAPAKVRQTLRDRIATARERRQEFADRGKAIVKDWREAMPVKDVDSLVNTVRSVDGAGDLAKSLRDWVENFPPASNSKSAAAKSSAHKAAPHKAAPHKATAHKPAPHEPTEPTEPTS